MSNTIALDVYQLENGTYQAFYPEVKIASGPAHGQPSTDTRPQPTRAPFPREMDQGFRWAPWGVSDCLPTEIRQKIEQVPIAGRTIEKLVAMMYGNGLCYFRNSDLESGAANIHRAYIPKVEQWLKRSKIRNKWLIAQLADYRMLWNSYSELILNRRKDFITGLYHKSAEFCRLSKQNEKTFKIDHLLYSPDFSMGLNPPPSRIRKVQLYDWQEEEAFFQKLSGFKFAYHSRFETPGVIYYARPFFLGLFRKHGWMDASIAVPEVVNAMMRNQIRLKYQILIPESYFTIRYRDSWHTYTDEQRSDVIDELVNKINDTLAGTTNAFQSITTVFGEDSNGNPAGKIEILAIDDKVKKDSWVPSAMAADAQIVQGMGLHPSQVGLANEGGKMGAGSGSDQRESFNTEINLNTIHQEIVLEPLNLVAQYNSQVDPDWDITFVMDHTFHTTTNSQESGMEPSQTSLQIE